MTAAKVSDRKVVSIHYTLKDSAGEVLDSSGGGEPLRYLHGSDSIISGLENALADKAVGDSFNVVIPPEEAYGEHDESLQQSVPRSAFEGIDNIEVGARFEAETDGGPVSVVVAAVDDETVVVDRNHPLAGETLHFDVEVVDLREASEEEIAHGHVH